MDIADRFWSQVKRGESDECWIWEGLIAQRDGYGRFACGKIDIGAHRMAWMLTNGPIPAGRFVCHHCDNPPCVNPSHLFAGTHADNPNRHPGEEGAAAFYVLQRETTGWRASCTCNADVVPCVVLDPFSGSGTVSLVSERLGRDSIGIDLSPVYTDMAAKRIRADCPMFAAVETV